jgi:hypothetical protein
MSDAGIRLASSHCPYEVTAWSQWFCKKGSSDASYVDGTSAFSKGGQLQHLTVIRDPKSECVTGVRATHKGQTSTGLGLGWPAYASAERTSSVLQLTENELIQKAEVWLRSQSTPPAHRYLIAHSGLPLVLADEVGVRG